MRVRDGAAILIHRQRVDCARVGDGAAVAIGSQDVVPCHVGRVLSCRVVSHHVMSRSVVSRRATSCHVIMSCLSCHAMSCHVRSHHIRSHHVTSCHVTSCHAVPCRFLSCRIVSCHVATNGRTSRLQVSSYARLCMAIWSRLPALVETGSTRRRPSLLFAKLILLPEKRKGRNDQKRCLWGWLLRVSGTHFNSCREK